MQQSPPASCQCTSTEGFCQGPTCMNRKNRDREDQTTQQVYDLPCLNGIDLSPFPPGNHTPPTGTHASWAIQVVTTAPPTRTMTASKGSAHNPPPKILVEWEQARRGRENAAAVGANPAYQHRPRRQHVEWVQSQRDRENAAAVAANPADHQRPRRQQPPPIRDPNFDARIHASSPRVVAPNEDYDQRLVARAARQTRPAGQCPKHSFLQWSFDHRKRCNAVGVWCFPITIYVQPATRQPPHLSFKMASRHMRT